MRCSAHSYATTLSHWSIPIEIVGDAGHIICCRMPYLRSGQAIYLAQINPPEVSVREIGVLHKDSDEDCCSRCGWCCLEASLSEIHSFTINSKEVCSFQVCPDEYGVFQTGIHQQRAAQVEPG